MKKVILSVVLAAALVSGFAATATAGRDPRPGYDLTTVKANHKVTYSIKFTANAKAEVTVKGDGTTALQLYVYDSTGKLVASDAAVIGDKKSVSFTPSLTQTYTVEIVNRNALFSNTYSMKTN